MTNWLAAFLLTAALGAGAPITGIVRDTSGAVVPGASVVARAPSGEEQQTLAGADGRFAIDAPGTGSGELTIIVRAAGFAEKQQRIDAAARELSIVLTPASLVEAVTVTASRGAIESGTPAVASVITAESLASTPAPMLDDQLKSVPGFSLFRRSSSRVANPTTQGVTMRGLSASGASRSLVLVDGVPLNDAFGGWIYWDRVPQTALDRVEIVRGGSSDLYGANAVGGVIQILTLSPTRAALRADAEIGSRSTPRISLFGGGAHDRWSGFASGEWQTTDGYVIVEPQADPSKPSPNLRGPVDIAANSDYKTLYASGGYQSGAWHAGVRGSLFTEARGNGTPLTNNDTNARELVGDFSGAVAGGFWQARAYGGTQNYNQTFSAVTTVNSLRTSESLTQAQHVPSSNTGATAQWTRLAGRTTWSVGADTSRTEGKSEETTFTRNVATGSSANGGVQWETGAFGRISFAAANDVTIVGAVRADRWTSTPTNPAASVAVATELSPKAGVNWRVSDMLVVHGTVTHAFRAPTLNELFRNFRAGSSNTTANDQLSPETLTGTEAGITLHNGPSAMRAVGFFNQLNDAITNVTVSATPTLITRQRRNAGTIHASGLDVEEELALRPAIHLTFGAEYVRSTFVDSLEPGLAGNKVSQVPPLGLSLTLRLNAPAGFLATGQFRYNGATFDDDKNTLPLGSVKVFDAYLSRSVGRGVQIFAAIENLFDSTYEVGNTPLITIGLPRTARIGVRAYLP
jgi:outer membrane receptor protein involved in Fe transport